MGRREKRRLYPRSARGSSQAPRQPTDPVPRKRATDRGRDQLPAPAPGRIVRAETRPQRDPKDAGPLRGVNMAGLKGWFGDRKETTGQAGQLWPW